MSKVRSEGNFASFDLENHKYVQEELQYTLDKPISKQTNKQTVIGHIDVMRSNCFVKKTFDYLGFCYIFKHLVYRSNIFSDNYNNNTS